jgi:hypothetical protein
MDITGYSKALILQALYNRAKPLGYGIFDYDPKPMTLEEAQELLENSDKLFPYFDYVKGRVMKICLGGEEINTRLYNRDNGPNAAEDAILEALTTPENK